MNRRHVLIGTAITLIAGSGLGIAAAAGGSTAEPPIGAVPVVTDSHQIHLPLDRYAQDATNRRTVLRAEYQLTASCMARFGIEFKSSRWGLAVPTQGNLNYRLYGLLDEEHAQNYGYHAGGSIPKSEIASNAMAANLPVDYSNVFSAVDGGGVLRGQDIPEGGCVGEARRQVGDDVSSDALPEELAAESWSLSNHDSRVTSGFHAWS